MIVLNEKIVSVSAKTDSQSGRESIEKRMNPEIALEYSLFFLIAAAVTVFDVKEYRIPDYLTLGGLFVLGFLKLLLGQSAIGLIAAQCCLGYATFWLIHRVTGGRLGLGDAKYSALIAVAVGVLPWFVALFIASVAGLIFAFIGIVFFGRKRQTRIPFAPFLTLGATVSVAVERFLPRL